MIPFHFSKFSFLFCSLMFKLDLFSLLKLLLLYFLISFSFLFKNRLFLFIDLQHLFIVVFLFLSFSFSFFVLQFLDKSLSFPLLFTLFFLIFNKSFLICCNYWNFFFNKKLILPILRELFSFYYSLLIVSESV